MRNLGMEIRENTGRSGEGAVFVIHELSLFAINGRRNKFMTP